MDFSSTEVKIAFILTLTSLEDILGRERERERDIFILCFINFFHFISAVKYNYLHFKIKKNLIEIKLFFPITQLVNGRTRI